MSYQMFVVSIFCKGVGLNMNISFCAIACIFLNMNFLGHKMHVSIFTKSGCCGFILFIFLERIGVGERNINLFQLFKHALVASCRCPD